MHRNAYETFYDWTFDVLLCVSGIQAEPTYFVRFRQLIWLAFIVFAALTYTEIFLVSSSSSEPLRFAEAVNLISPVLSTACVIVLLWRRREISNFIQERSTRRSILNLVISLSPVFPWIAHYVISVDAEPTVDSLKQNCFDLIFLIPYCTFFLVYFDSLRCVKNGVKRSSMTKSREFLGAQMMRGISRRLQSMRYSNRHRGAMISRVRNLSFVTAIV